MIDLESSFWITVVLLWLGLYFVPLGGILWLTLKWTGRSWRAGLVLVLAILLYALMLVGVEWAEFWARNGLFLPLMHPLQDTLPAAIGAPLRLFTAALPVLIAFAAIRLYVRSTSKQDAPHVGAIDDDTVRTAVAGLLRAPHFLNALSDSLPRGEKDEEYGLDYIPYMLKSIRERRERFQRQSNLFLLSSVVLGVVFAGVVFVFGLVVVNDEYAGTPRLLARMNRNLEATQASLAVLGGRTIGEDTFREMVAPRLDALQRTSPGQGNRAVDARVDSVLATSRSASQSMKIDSMLRSAASRAVRRGTADIHYAAALDSAVQSLEQYSRSVNGALQQLSTVTDALAAAYPALQNARQTDDVRTAELIKRIAVGIVVSTFFLAILRYVAGIYRLNYNEMLRAESEDLKVRRFYIALKASAERPEDIRAVVTEFLSGRGTQDGGESANASPDLSKEEAALLKDFVQALLKKI